MILALLVSLVCFATPGAPVDLALVKHTTTEPPMILGCGCPMAAGPCVSCEVTNIVECIPWEAWTTADSTGCVDFDRLPKPPDPWVYWVRQ